MGMLCAGPVDVTAFCMFQMYVQNIGFPDFFQERAFARFSSIYTFLAPFFEVFLFP